MGWESGRANFIYLFFFWKKTTKIFGCLNASTGPKEYVQMDTITRGVTEDPQTAILKRDGVQCITTVDLMYY